MGLPVSKILIIGVGNEYRGDDAVGLLVARRLRSVLQQEIDVLEYNSDITGLIDLWGPEDIVYIIDAVSSDDVPGTIARFDAGSNALPSEIFRCSTHVVDLGQLLELARALERMPKRLIIYAVAGQKFKLGDTLSAGIGEAVKRVVDHIEEELNLIQ
ncbi:MAG: hydrogenase maturation protease [Chlamydiota bacterium]|nr:hydrogenase maturation protease [Chlamydiota bacterium]